MHVNELWNPEGILSYEAGNPVAIAHRVLVEPPVGSEWERSLAAALIELSVRFGLELPRLPRELLENVYVEFGEQATGSMADSVSTSASLQDRQAPGGGRLQLVIGTTRAWLASVIGPGVDADAFFVHYDALDTDEGLVSIVGERFAVAAGKTPLAMLSAVRAIASDNMGCEFPNSSAFRVKRQDVELLRSGDGTRRDSQPGKVRLEHLFSTGGAFRDVGDVLPELDARFLITSNAALSEVLALAGRLGLEAGRVRFPVTCLEKDELAPSRVTFQVRVDESQTEGSIEMEHNSILIAGPSEDQLRAVICRLIDDWFTDPDDVTDSNWQGKLRALQSAHPDIQMRAECELELSRLLYKQVDIQSITAPFHLEKAVRPWCAAQGVDVSTLPAPLLWQEEWSAQSELDTIERQLAEAMAELHAKADDASACVRACSSITPSDTLVIELFTSQSNESFDAHLPQFLAAIHGQRAAGQGMPQVQVVYRDVMKAGFHWIMDDVLPELRLHSGGIARVELNARKVSQDGRALDMPQRFLQELFPSDAILADELGIPVDCVTLGLLDEGGPMYEVTAFDGDDKLVGAWAWESLTQTRHYTIDDANSPIVLVPAAGFRISRVASDGQRDVLKVSVIPTTYSLFWDWFQRDVLLHIPERVIDAGGPTPFARLEVEVSVDSAEMRLGVYEEVSSFPEALHEEIYFYSLHAFQRYAKQVDQPAWMTPGAVIPLIHTVPGSPRATIRLYGHGAQEGVTVDTKSGKRFIRVHPVHAKAEWDALQVSRVGLCDGHWRVYVSSCPSRVPVEDVARWLNDKPREIRPVKESGSSSLASHFLFARDSEQPNVQSDILQNEDVAHWLMSQDARLPGRAWVLDTSFQGHPIVAVELRQPSPEAYLTSRSKDILFKPTLFIVARHHANEVSSTNAALILIAKLIENPQLLRHCNVIVIPIQNVDGAQLHRRLIEEHPFWKHHAARFNACGFEFAHHYFDEHTPFGESRTFARVWQQWKPDVVIDDHGIPSHEWLQPFAGYNSPPSFPVSYWIPHAQIYTIWRSLPAHCDAADGPLRETISRTLASDAAIRERNRIFLERYMKWGTAFHEEKFPVTTVDGVITYQWIVTPERHSRDLIARFPDWVTADIITEVNDETVHGDALAEVVHAHSKVHEGLVQWITQVSTVVNRIHTPEGATGCVALSRQRPLRTSGM
ncbi:M14 family metallopeptidase [Alicyclobacillus fastidiosus]|uniref:M14 family metallopeptidase n=1 Tax=Alicyclobacillus fastidiosus TaxID=392011 RepID=A0ABV5A955_9BACL|nr:M14 family metallopeptidase [Alicyclobacillus fastidiosus]WEH10688.1 M14 family metallopeptidase [Alicyclobacillus fastidiosus]